MQMKRGKSETGYTSGTVIEMTGDEVATAIDAWLVAHQVIVNGPRTIRVNGSLIKHGEIYVDPSGRVLVTGNEVVGDTLGGFCVKQETTKMNCYLVCQYRRQIKGKDCPEIMQVLTLTLPMETLISWYDHLRFSRLMENKGSVPLLVCRLLTTRPQSR